MLTKKKPINPIFKKALGVGLVLLACLLAYNKWYQWKDQQKLEQQISELRKEAAKVEAQNRDLEKSLELFSTEAAKEKIARTQLNLKKDGEEAVVFIAPQKDETTNPQVKEKSNLRLWWEYFFIKNSNE